VGGHPGPIVERGAGDPSVGQLQGGLRERDGIPDSEQARGVARRKAGVEPKILQSGRFVFTVRRQQRGGGKDGDGEDRFAAMDEERLAGQDPRIQPADLRHPAGSPGHLGDHQADFIHMGREEDFRTGSAPGPGQQGVQAAQARDTLFGGGAAPGCRDDLADGGLERRKARRQQEGFEVLGKRFLIHGFSIIAERRRNGK
jgi:hypothetical protein